MTDTTRPIRPPTPMYPPKVPTAPAAGEAVPLGYAMPGLRRTTQPLATRSMLATGFIAVSMLLAVIEIPLLWSQVGLLQRMEVGAFTMEEVAANDLRITLVALVGLAVFIGGAITFIRWLYRAAINLDVRGVTQTHRPGWAIGAWFVPFLNLIRPYHIVRDVWQGSSESTSSAIVGVWWICWLSSGFIVQISTRIAQPATTPKIDALVFATRMDMASSLLTIIAGVMAILIIRQVTAAQDDIEPA